MAVVDVSTQIVIDRPIEEVAEYVADPTNAPQWYDNIESVEWETSPPARVGSAVTFIARFMGRRLEYTYEFVDYVQGERLVMRTREGPFPMETSYRWTALEPGSTRMELRNRGEPGGFSRWAAPVIGPAMRRANTKDLGNLKGILEG